MNYQEILTTLEDKFEDVTEFAFAEEIPLDWGLGPMQEVAQKGGEGEGEEWYSVKYFPEHDIYIKIEGYYASYDGTSFDGFEDCSQVRPEQKTITVYE